MRLSRLHINGFKSFPDRAELGFDHGVTAIVGPNGCGKSNVVDAITWVLGEQSAKSLRGERMEDVIFNGSDARKPTATAEVRLSSRDVAQARARGRGRRARSGDPLARRAPRRSRATSRSAGGCTDRARASICIDGEVCRLRDIHDLLMDSGLGVKAYAVIEQGKIGQILSSRPAERRALIEEAAGVTKYKSRRRAAELKLEAAQQNLTRIDDIIFEVEKQRGALQAAGGAGAALPAAARGAAPVGAGAVRAPPSCAVRARSRPRRRRLADGRTREAARGRARRGARIAPRGAPARADARRRRAPCKSARSRRTPASSRSAAASSRWLSTGSRSRTSVAGPRRWPPRRTSSSTRRAPARAAIEAQRRGAGPRADAARRGARAGRGEPDRVRRGARRRPDGRARRRPGARRGARVDGHALGAAAGARSRG